MPSGEAIPAVVGRNGLAWGRGVRTDLPAGEPQKREGDGRAPAGIFKLGPAFGMVGTITGMIQLFRNMNAENLNIGAAMSLALLATLYGVAFGAGVAGPIGHYLNGLLDERLGFIERCEKSVNETVSRVVA